MTLSDASPRLRILPPYLFHVSRDRLGSRKRFLPSVTRAPMIIPYRLVKSHKTNKPANLKQNSKVLLPDLPKYWKAPFCNGGIFYSATLEILFFGDRYTVKHSTSTAHSSMALRYTKSSHQQSSIPSLSTQGKVNP